MSGNSKRAYGWHLAMGAPLVALFFVVCFSGTVAVVAGELRTWERPELWSLPTAEGTKLDPVTERAFAYENSEGNMFVAFDDDFAVAGWSVPGQGFTWEFIASTTGETVAVDHSRVLGRVERLHTNLLGSGLFSLPGRLLVGFSGLAFLAMLSSGLWLHGSWRSLLKKRWPRQPRARAAFIHRWTGLGLVPFAVGIAATGAFVGLTFVLIGIGAQIGYGGDRDAAVEALGERLTGLEEAGEPGPVASPLNLDTLIERHRDADHVLEGIELRHWGHEDGVVVFQEKDTTWRVAGPSRIRVVSATTGELVETVEIAQTRTTIEAYILAIAPLHYATYGPAAVRWLYFLAGLALSAMVVLGLEVWRRRVPESGPARVSLAICLGLVAASLLSGVASRMLPAADPGHWTATLVFVGMWVGGTLAFDRALAARPQRMDVITLGGFAGVMLLAVVLSAASAPWADRPTLVIVVDAVYLALAVVFVLVARRRAARTASSPLAARA